MSKSRTKTTTQPPPKRGRGQPKSIFEARMMFRHHAEQEERWRRAAATCGMELHDWLRATLDAEATHAHHVPLLKRSA